MAPPKFKVAGKMWDEKVLFALSVLSSFTHGQSQLAKEFLEEAVKLRIDEGEDVSPQVQVVDVSTAVAIVYERAGVVPAKMKNGKGGGRERRKAIKEKKKTGGTARDKRTGSGSS